MYSYQGNFFLVTPIAINLKHCHGKMICGSEVTFTPILGVVCIVLVIKSHHGCFTIVAVMHWRKGWINQTVPYIYIPCCYHQCLGYTWAIYCNSTQQYFYMYTEYTSTCHNHLLKLEQWVYMYTHSFHPECISSLHEYTIVYSASFEGLVPVLQLTRCEILDGCRLEFNIIAT